LKAKKQISKPKPPPKKVMAEDLFDFQRVRLPGPEHLKRGVLQAQNQDRLMRIELSTRYGWLSHINLQLPSQPEISSDLHVPKVHDFFDYVYHAEGKKNLPSSNRFRKIVLMEKSISNDLVYISIPSRSQQVFRQIRLKNPLDAPLLRGPVEVYHNKQFLLQSSFNNIPANGPFRFDLGVEANVRVSRNMTSKENIEGMFMKEKVIQNQVQFAIKNNLASTIQMELIEVLPSIKEKESVIKISALESNPEWNLKLPRTDPEGAKGWALDIEGQASQDYSFSYTITIPTDKELVGGNRRGES